MAHVHAQLTARDIHDPYSQLLVNLQGNDGRVWLDALKVFLRKENPWPKRASEYQVWKTVTTGGRTTEVWHRVLKENKIDVDMEIGDFDEVKMHSPKRFEADLVRLAVSELGFPSPVFYRQAIKRATSLGFTLCSVEHALALRLAYLDQPVGESVYVPIQAGAREWALEAGPHPTLNGVSIVLDHIVYEEDDLVGRDSSRPLDIIRLRRIQEWAHNQNCYPTNKLVFVKPRK
ncbi:MAG: hypothetical protein KA066_01285 [Candidatus Pacebacteria bacterium]|nr:hypothetical protein [Candidatus Paceibacterota bacterium]